MRRSSSTKAGSTAKATCPAIAAMSASSPVWRRFCRARRSGSPAIWRARIRPRRPFSPPEISKRRTSLQQDKDLAEQHLGDWQGLDRHTFLMNRSQEPDSFWYATADERAPNGESFVDLVQRVGAAIERATKKHQGGDIVAVAHGGTIRAAIAIALGLPPRGGFAFMIDNCSLTRLDHYQRPDALRLAGHHDQSPAVNSPIRSRSATLTEDLFARHDPPYMSRRECLLPTAILMEPTNEAQRTQSAQGQNRRRHQGRHHVACSRRSRSWRHRHGVDHQRGRGRSCPAKGRRRLGGHQGVRRDDRQVAAT